MVEEGADILGHFRELQFAIAVGIEHLQLSIDKINNKQTNNKNKNCKLLSEINVSIRNARPAQRPAVSK